MRAAVVHAFDVPPSYGEFPEPSSVPGSVMVDVAAAALSPLVKIQAGGKHYSTDGGLPFVAGVDGVGRLADGTRVYFAFPDRPWGAMAERVAARREHMVAIPAGLDDVTAAALANPGMSSWVALKARAGLRAGESVLVNGATGTSGRLAVRIARHLGAGRIVATGRNEARLTQLAATEGVDAVIPLTQVPDMLTKAFRRELTGAGIDVVLDYLWGPSAEAFLAAVTGHGTGRAEPRVRYVQIGSMGGQTITFPAGALRSSGLELVGSGLGSVSHPELVRCIGEMLHAAGPAGLAVDLEAVPLAQVGEAWDRRTDRRIVFTM